MNAQVIAITNQKGGVGKTTTTFNLGVGLAHAGKRVLLVDADPQGSLTISTGIKVPDDLETTLATLMQHEMEYKPLPHDLGIIRNEEGVDLLPSNIELSGLEVSLFNTMSREQVLRKTLSEFSHQYDYILIDCTPSLGMMTINSLVAAEQNGTAHEGVGIRIDTDVVVCGGIVEDIVQTLQQLDGTLIVERKIRCAVFFVIEELDIGGGDPRERGAPARRRLYRNRPAVPG